MRRLFIFLSLLGSITACRLTKEHAQISAAKTAISTTSQQYAPDKRVAILKVEAQEAPRQKRILLKGETNLPEAKEHLLNELLEKHIPFQDSIQLLPAKDLGSKIYGVVSISVANLRSEPRDAAELASQAILGTPVKVLNWKERRLLIQTPDDYIAWVDSGGIQKMNQNELDTWLNAPKLIYLNPFGLSYIEPNTQSQPVSDLVEGNVIRLEGEKGSFYKVAFPDGRVAYVPKTEAQPYKKWIASLHPTETSLVATAKNLMGIPYLWGGTSTKGMDCSGFTKTIYFMNGLVLPRDASQQVHTGDLVETSNGFDQLKPGDLLFFGKPATDTTPERVVHVGMWIGKKEFIQASYASSRVIISSFDPTAPHFDENNFKRFLRAKRILNTNTGDIVKLSSARLY
jgi:cell wall-associated NlpC family hydrolase